VVRRDGSKRLLGDYGTASWSPHGLYVAAADDRQLLALEPDGDVRWSLARPVPHHTAWSPDGFRIAYLSRGDLRLVGADGAGDHLLARGVAPLAPAWRPGSPRRLAYATAAGRVRVLDLKSGSSRLLFGAGAPARALAWSAQGSRLLVATRARIFVLDPRGGIVRDWPVPEGERVAAAALSPDGARTAVVLRGAPGRRSRLLLLDRRRPPRDLFAGPGVFDGVFFSPDGRWLLLAWRTADEWVFLEPRHPRRVLAVSGIAEQFDPGTTSRPAFPSVAGWCCPLAPGG
jgi:dipeptidyl aminopeptidase/acylaminoacyl peptidase